MWSRGIPPSYMFRKKYGGAPSTFKGFRSLRSLCLNDATMAEIWLFPLLCLRDWLWQNAVASPTSRFAHQISIFFTLKAYLSMLLLRILLSLAEVYVDLDSRYYHRRAPGSCSHLIKFFVHLPHIRRLKIQNCSLLEINCVVSYFHLLWSFTWTWEIG